MIHSLDLPVKLEDDILVSIEQHQTITKPASLGGTDTWLGCTGAPLPCGLRPRCARSSSPLLRRARAPNQLRCFNRATPDHNKTRLVGRDRYVAGLHRGSAALWPSASLRSLFLAPTLRGSGAKPASLFQSSNTRP